LEVPANNSILADYLRGSLPADAALTLIEHVGAARYDVGDDLLIQNNLAVFLIQNSQLDAAKHILNLAQAELGDRGDSDGYHRYFINNNIARILALEGKMEAAKKLLDAVGKDLDDLYPAIQQTLKRRHRMMHEVIASAPTLTTAAFDSYLGDHYEQQVGPQWKFYGRTFLFSDIQFWASE